MFLFLINSYMSKKFSFLCSCFLNIQICLSPSTISGDKFPLSVPSSLHKTSAQCKVPAFSSVGLAMLACMACLQCLHCLLAMLACLACLQCLLALLALLTCIACHACTNACNAYTVWGPRASFIVSYIFFYV